MINLSKPYLGSEELEAVKKIMDSGCCAGTCPEVHRFEEKFAHFVGSRYAVATSSCTTALHLACLALGVNNKSNIIVPAYTFPATAFAPLYCGADIQIADVEPDTFNIDVECLSDVAGLSDLGTVDVIIPVHCFGNPADMDAVKDYAEDNDAKIIEDAACALPAYHHGKHAGTIGDVGCYSFYCIKNLCTGEGGMLVTDNEEIAEKARSLCDFGKTTSKPLPRFTQLGYNYRLSSIQAAMGIEQLKKLPWMHSRRLEIAKRYDEFISSELSNYAYSQVVPDRCTSAYQRYAIVLNPRINRDKVMEDMAAHKVQCAIGTYDISTQPYFSSSHKECAVSRTLFEQSISLPMYPELSEEEVDTVCAALKECVKH
uniref:Putative DegT/DnrJ/EryC1/StrS aminotransferase family protein n=1 Tax=viral metagenome TaxID=1070528 RepID=A0A6H1ZJQ9_9ZZZZ